MGCGGVGTLRIQVIAHALQTKPKRNVIWVLRIDVSAFEVFFLNYRRDQSKRCISKNLRQLLQKSILAFFGLQKCEVSDIFPDVTLVQHDSIMPEMLELEVLNGGNYSIHVVRFPDHAKRQNEHRVARVNRFQSVVATFINENEKI